MAINWSEERAYWGVCQLGNLLLSHFGYAAIATAASLFKLAIAASLASYIPFLCATLVGGFVTYFLAKAIVSALVGLGLSTDFSGLAGFALQFGLSPMVGAYVFNWALGWSLLCISVLAEHSFRKRPNTQNGFTRTPITVLLEQ